MSSLAAETASKQLRVIAPPFCMEIRVGTSGFHYKHWIGNFYPPKTPTSKMLEHYLRYFDTVELNNSFYKLPSVEAFATWRDAVPSDFIFAVKGSRFITHNKKLKDPENALENLIPRAEVLGDKLGPILFQLPPKWRCNVARLEEFLQALPNKHRYAFEFREPSWHCEDVLNVLRSHNAAYCIYELAGFRTQEEITADWTYVRLHGPGGKYQGSYSDDAMNTWAKTILSWDKKLRSAYIYFDNDQSGFAAANARQLKKSLGKLGFGNNEH